MSRVRLPSQLTVLTTSRCTAACDHCTMRSSPTRNEMLPTKTVASVIDQLAQIDGFAVVNFAGGEPTLAKRGLFEGIAQAAALGLATRLVTNASWATSAVKATAMLRRLRDAGLAELVISADDFHLPYVPIERVVTAWRASRGLGFVSVAIVNCTTRDCLVTPEYLLGLLGAKATEVRMDPEGHAVHGLPEHNGTAYVISSGPTLRMGQALDSLDAETFDYAPSLDAIAGSCPHAVNALALSPTGMLVACCSTEAERYEALVLGNAVTTPVAEILASAAHKPILQAIAALGPVAVMRFVQAKTDRIAFRERYTSMCEVCEHLTSRPEVIRLLEKHADALAEAVPAA